MCNPLNYQPPGAILYRKANKLISIRKNEIIEINVEEVLYYQELLNWSTNKISIIKTEKNLRDYIYDNIDKLLGIKTVEKHKEFKTPVGDVDILAIDVYGTYHILEVKRGKASLAACSQLERYCNYFVDISKNVRDYIISPDISEGARQYASDNFQTYIKIDHSI